MQAKEATSSEEDISSGDENPGEGVGSDLLMTKPESTLQHKDNGTLAARRNRKQKWEPPEGMRRCGQKCTGCAAKCASMGQEECSSCQINRVKETSKNICLNRGPCLNLKEQRPQADRSRKKSKIPGQRDNSNKSLPRSKTEVEKKTATTIKVGQQAVVSRVDLVKDVVENIEGLEKEGGKKNREVTGQTPENERKTSKIAVLQGSLKESSSGRKGGIGGSLPPLL